MELDLECPNGHNLAVSFTREEFEDQLRAGVLVFHCNTCDTNWTPTPEEIAELRKGFDQA
jgi:hypothetical protein